MHRLGNLVKRGPYSPRGVVVSLSVLLGLSTVASPQTFTNHPRDPGRQVETQSRSEATLTRPRTVDFVPRTFYRELSADIAPVLRISPGDIVRTKSVDAAGQDEKSQQRAMPGNPLTGPFYVEGTLPGDVLAITILRLHPNRGWGFSGNNLVGRAQTNQYASENQLDWDRIRWRLDALSRSATIQNATGKLKNFTVQLSPMLGCVGVAPGFGEIPLSTRDSGNIGGNLDFNRITEGATVFLQVNQTGGLLYLGDAHALQGDGELNGAALETSMDIEFTVNVIPQKRIGSPRVEDKDYLMTIGLGGSLDDAFRTATSELATWLQSDYKLTALEAAVVLGSSIEYNVAEVADRNVGIVAKIRKNILLSLPPPG